VAESDTPVMRVEASQGYYWRGNTYDYYTGRTFENQIKAAQRLAPQDEHDSHSAPAQEASGGGPDLERFTVPRSAFELPAVLMRGAHKVDETVTVLLGGTSQCYGAGLPAAVSVPKGLGIETTAAGGIYAAGPLPVNAQYRVRSITPTDDPTLIRAAADVPDELPGAVAMRYLQLAPAGHPDAGVLRDLAQKVTAGLTNSYDKATAIRSYIAQSCKYNLQAPAAPPNSDRVEHFLTVSPQGYCDSFAASMTMLARYAGIPARVATGYITGQPDGKGGFIVRQKDKHAWSELFFPGVGWIPFDATDGAEDISDHNLNRRTQNTNFAAWLFSHGLLPPILAGTIGILAVYLVWTELIPRLRRPEFATGSGGFAPTNAAVVQAYLDARGLLGRRGPRLSKSVTPVEFLAAIRPGLAAISPAAVEAVDHLTELHDRFRYGRETASATDVEDAAAALAGLRTALSNVSGKALASMSTAHQAAQAN
jgi:transglutaminase-like putative cysteine protease